MESLPGYDGWKLENPFDGRKPAGHCAECGEPVYDGQVIWMLDGEVFCGESCALEYVGAWKSEMEVSQW